MSLHETRRGTRSAMRQLLYPRELRIAAPVWPQDLVGALQRLATQPAPPPAPVPGAALPFVADRAADERVLAEVATGLFRARRAIGDDAQEQSSARVRRHVQSAADALARAGVEVVDLTGRPYDSGLAGIDVIAFEDSPGIERETVVETIRPGVYIDGRRVQESQVVVGVPAAAGTPHPARQSPSQETP